MLSLIEISFMCAIVAWVYAEVLVKPEMILHPFYKWICRVWLLKTKIVGDREIEYESWFYKPVIGCFKCVSGQFALWCYLIWALKNNSYNLLHHVFVICFTICIAIMINHVDKWFEKQ